ncbi:urease accessory protein UreD [uncultured Ruegeria sp.]|uniref:urease accessory protein UreD n=1 Tax=uncultured Ruegeria sp. TaxID=259304 RepID=UPI00260460AC|nr:urease accessory protein UreD [uncultured Ruegeria sp.]
MARIRFRGCPITQFASILPQQGANPPRAKGVVNLSTKKLGENSVLDTLLQSGSSKCLFPRASAQGLDAVLLNTAGGVTGGDSFRFTANAAEGTTLTLTTQACERAYKAQPRPYAQISNHLTVSSGARLNWLPQETILFNGSALDRRLQIEMDPDATMLLVEPLVFGRAAMGETLTDIRLRDRIEILRDGAPAFLDAMRFSGDLQAHLCRPHVANGAGAMALVVFASATAEGQLAPVRHLLPDTAGASLIQNDMLVIRMLAKTSFALRRALMPVLRRLNNDTLPRCWML